MILLGFFFILAASMPVFIRSVQKQRARERMAAQFRAALQNMAHALRVGVGLSQAIDYVAKEGAEPLAGEWRHTLQAVRLGQSLATALDGFKQRVPIKEAGWFVTAVQITQNSGGSLADVLETMSATMQDQQALREKVRALTAQGKASGVLLSLLPYALLGALAIVAPEMATPLFTTFIGQLVLVVVTISLVIGGLIIKKIVTIPVE